MFSTMWRLLGRESGTLDNCQSPSPRPTRHGIEKISPFWEMKSWPTVNYPEAKFRQTLTAQRGSYGRCVNNVACVIYRFSSKVCPTSEFIYKVRCFVFPTSVLIRTTASQNFFFHLPIIYSIYHWPEILSNVDYWLSK